MTQEQINYLAQLHSGQWFGFDGEPEYKNLWVEGHPKPTLKQINDGIPLIELQRWRSTFSVPTYKLEIELEERGLMTTVQALINGASRSTQIGWEKSPTVRRMSPTMLALAQHPSLALTAEDLDDIFKSAELREL